MSQSTGPGGPHPLTPATSDTTPSPPQSWVQFDNDERPQQELPTAPSSPSGVAALPPPPTKAAATATAAAAVIDAHAVQVSLGTGRAASRTVSEPHASNGSAQPISSALRSPSSAVGTLHTVQLSEAPITPPTPITSPIRQGFANGDVIVTLLPQNTHMAWITPATFRPELVPEELMAQGLTLTVEDYVHVMTQLVNDERFKLFNICYKRIVIAWIILGFFILLCILFFSGGKQLELFGAGIAWLLLNAAAIFLCMWIKIRLNRGLERCMAGINLQLMKHKILLGLDDRGKLSCHKVNLCFIYFDTTDCLTKLQQLIDDDTRSSAAAAASGAAGERPSLQSRLDIDDPDIIISGATITRISRDQDRSLLLLARYSQRWAKNYLRKRLDWAFDALARVEGLAPPTPPRHLSTARCLCQYIESHLGLKDLLKQKELASKNSGCCGTIRSFFREVEAL
ncbi:transmembrane protein 268 isoform X5 [Hyalella azteca]|uniref:Transmembrane protein 268 isoform X3 n=1 Tax=Hyalella azteca TaxID=294128 RepID=A0A979FVT2_HYAAZ|nr:transmembrane protein 268 isoform X3 [Hyalella azteca]XP_047741370.1 transmembrane protein 268 isoform X4 [Hyalella azteca]XP_047741371.1 transmembrane protein 268 isoform X5 [Hyalella azteca]